MTIETELLETENNEDIKNTELNEINETNELNEFELKPLPPEPCMARASFSRLEYYHNCPKAFKYKYIDKLEPLSAPVILDANNEPKPAAWERGNVIHQAMDDYINDVRTDLIPQLKTLSFEIKEARDLKRKHPERVLTEQNKYFDTNYEIIDMESLSEDEKTVTTGGDPCPLDYHLLIIIDLLIFNEDFTEARVIDLKSGKERLPKHIPQTRLYALFTSVEYPIVQNFITELWYCDQHGKVHKTDYSKEKIRVYFNYWDRRIMQLMNDKTHYSKPSENACFFCAWGAPEHSTKWVNKLGRCKDSKDKRYRK